MPVQSILIEIFQKDESQSTENFIPGVATVVAHRQQMFSLIPQQLSLKVTVGPN